MKIRISRRIAYQLAFYLAMPAFAFAQGAKEFVDKNGKDKIRKSVQVAQAPVTAAGFGDGHGINPVLTDRKQIPDTIALISFYMNDVGTVKEGPYSISSYWISADGGNEIANEIEKQTMASLKASFLKEGVVLLTPLEFLNTPAKRSYYYDKFVPQVSRLAKFLSNIETKQVDVSVGANYYRPFDISVCWDSRRAESLIADLAKNLGVKGVATIAFNMQTDSKYITMLGARIAINGPNPIPKEDKKYVAQNMGNGYYEGQVYADCSFNFPKPVLVGKYENIKKKDKKVTSSGIDSYTVKITQSAEISLDVRGMETVMEALVEKSFETMYNAIDKAAPKYSRK